MYRESKYGKKAKLKRSGLEDLNYNQLIRKLDAEVGSYIKRKYEVAPGISQCYTCKNYFHTNEIQAGHFISRRYFATRFDLRNIRPQCPGCNKWRAGEPFKFRMYLVEEIGEDQVKDLEFTAKMNGEKHLAREWLIEQVNFFRKKNKELKNENHNRD
jgi:hypothetical protein